MAWAVLLVLMGVAAAVVYLSYRRVLRRAKSIERGLKMVPMLIHLPPRSSDTAAEGRDSREVFREKISQAEVLYNVIAGTAQAGFKSQFYGQRHISLELIATGGLIHFYAAVPVALVSVVQKAVLTAYPGAQLEEIQDYNIFSAAGKIAGTAGGELTLKHETVYPIAQYEQLERDPMEAIINALSALDRGEGAAIQMLIRPSTTNWTKRAIKLVKTKRYQAHAGMKFTAFDLMRAAVKPRDPSKPDPSRDLTNLELSILEAIENKTKHPGYETLVRIVAASDHQARTQVIVRDIVSAFALFEAPGLNGFKYLPAKDVQGLVTAFIFRFFPPELKSVVLNTAELATIFHLPDAQFTSSAQLERQGSKQIDGPPQLPPKGLLLGFNQFRGVNKEVRLSDEDRRRHTYIVGQTGTGKSTLLENLAVQDMMGGAGFAFIDPHGDTAEKLLGLVPKHRAEDVIYFDPADSEFPLGLNLFEFSSPEQKDFLIQEAIAMLYRLYDPGHTGIIGPRYEHWFRNAALTLMSDPSGATFIEIPKVFTDTNYLKAKFKYLTDPTVIDFWTKEMAQTSDYHKSEVLGWFVSKFGAFVSNEIMRNIIGQTKSAFNVREIMDQKKILIVNLSKGRIGELNSQLLGMIFVTKFQAAAMSRASLPPEQRTDFSLYVDEFQNFSTDSFASILSEARKYGLNLIVANQFIGQLSDQIREAVFGNVGTIISYRTGPEDAEGLVRQFAPAFDARDLVNMPNFQAAIRLMVGGLPSQPFSLAAVPPAAQPNPQLALAIKQLSAAKHGVPRQQVEAELQQRMSGVEAAANFDLRQVQNPPADRRPAAPRPVPTAPDIARASAPAPTPPVAQSAPRPEPQPRPVSRPPAQAQSVTPQPPSPPKPPAQPISREPKPADSGAKEHAPESRRPLNDVKSTASHDGRLINTQSVTPKPVSAEEKALAVAQEQARQAAKAAAMPQNPLETTPVPTMSAQPATSTPAASTPAVTMPNRPKLRPGEVMIQEDGTVIQG